ncbi:MAG: hypothetical protein JWP34_5154 [Massilia sp.]|jgi:hypothetical protein|nr:hypothetical protein [Massilia sp.]
MTAAERLCMDQPETTPSRQQASGGVPRNPLSTVRREAGSAYPVPLEY